MKRSRFTDSQIMAVLRQAEAETSIPDLCREHGISTATFYKWRSKFGGMDVSLMARMSELEEENRRLKKLYVEAQIKPDIVAEALAKSSKAISPPRGGQMGGRGEGSV
jgi:putative transposase